MANSDAAIACRRFGLGPKPGDLKRVAGDPRGYVLAALNSKTAARIDDPGLEPSHAVLIELADARAEKKLAQAFANDPMMAGNANANAGAGAAAAPSAMPGQIRKEALKEETAARIERARSTDTPFL